MISNQNNPYSGMQNIFGANCPQEAQYWPQYYMGMQAITASEINRRNLIHAAAAQNAMSAIKPKKPLNFAARAAIAHEVAKTPKERRLADLMVFVAKYREHKPGIVIFPAWLSEDGRNRLLAIAKRH